MKDRPDEADLPTKPPEAQTPPRLPHPFGDAWRPQGARGAARARPRQAFGLKLTRLKRRADFLAANKGARAATPGFVLLVRPRGDDDDAARVGFTVTKKIGGAVVRNRLKRRLRALAREVMAVGGAAGADHVLIGRGDGVNMDFAGLRADLAGALKRTRR